MKKFLANQLIKRTFRDFFKIPLTPVEEEIANFSIRDRYAPILIRSFLWSLLGVPAVVYLDTTVIGIVLTPITMVAGTAWFAISLSTVKAKFVNFGLTLCNTILESFVISLCLMLFMAVYALNVDGLYFLHNVSAGPVAWLKYISGILGAVLVIRIVYLIVTGSIKYDVNDGMLSGQNEAAQNYFTKALDFSHEVTNLIRREPEIRTTNYYIADAFSRLFNMVITPSMQANKKDYTEKLKIVRGFNERALVVIKNPAMDQKEVYKIFLELVDGFKDLLNPKNKSAQKISFIDIEIDCLRSSQVDDDRIKALRYAMIFTLIFEITKDEGQDLFLT